MSFRLVMGRRDEIYAQHLRHHGLDVTEVDMYRNDEDETIEKMYGYEAVAARGEIFSPRVLEALKDHLKIVLRHGTGYDLVDVNHAAKLGICCCNTPGAMSAGVAETAVAMILECARGFWRINNRLKAGGWGGGEATHQVEGSTVGFVGFGSIAQRTARYLSGFGCRLLAYDKFPNEAALAEAEAQKADLDTIARQSDFISLHLPLTPETNGLVDAAFLAKMKPTAYLINTSRGGTVDEAALLDALTHKTIAGAGLDVFRQEPLPVDSPFRKLDNVFMTPHCAVNTYECTFAGFDGILRSLEEFRAGKVPAACLNPDYVNYLA